MAKEIKPTMSNDQLDLIYHRLENVFNTLVDMNIDMMRDWLAEGDIKMFKNMSFWEKVISLFVILIGVAILVTISLAGYYFYKEIKKCS